MMSNRHLTKRVSHGGLFSLRMWFVGCIYKISNASGVFGIRSFRQLLEYFSRIGNLPHEYRVLPTWCVSVSCRHASGHWQCTGKFHYCQAMLYLSLAHAVPFRCWAVGGFCLLRNCYGEISSLPSRSVILVGRLRCTHLPTSRKL